MIIYFYLFIPLLCRFAESSSIKGRNHKNDLVPFLSSRPDTQKDNSLKIVSNEPFIIQFQMPPQSKENVHHAAKIKDKKKKRPDKKRVSKIKPLRKKIRKRRDVPEAENKKQKLDQSMNLPTEIQSNYNKTQNFISRKEMLKALNIHLKKKETKKLKSKGIKHVQDVENTDDTSIRKLHPNYSTSTPDRDLHVKMIYPNTPKSDSHNYSYKDLIADRERLEQKINYIRNMLKVNDTIAEDAMRIRRKSDSDNTANKIAKMFLTLSAVNGLHDRQFKCRDDDDDRALDIWKKERKKTPSRQSSSSNEERYKVKKWIEYMKNKRSSGKTCPCMNEYNEETDIFPLEQKLAKDYPLTGTGTSSEEDSEKYRDPLSHSRGRPNKSGPNRNSYKEDTRSRLRALTNRGRKRYDLPIDDLELYRSRAKQILQNAEEILDKIKEEEEKRLAAPHALASRLRELTSRIQGDPRNNENDFIKIIQKNLGWTPQYKSQSSADNNSFVENMKSFILDPYEKAKALTDESTKKLSSYLLRNLGKIDSSEEQEEPTEKSESLQVFHGQVPQTEEMYSANLAKENPESDLLAKEREEHQNWSDTLSAILGSNIGDSGKENTEGDELKQMKSMEDSIKRRMEEIIKEQGKKINEYTEKPDDLKKDETTIVDLMTGKQIQPSKDSKEPEDAEKITTMYESEKQGGNIEKSEAGAVNQNGVTENGSETVKLTHEENESDVTASEHQQPPEDQIVSEEFAESVDKNIDTEGDEKSRSDFPSESQDVKGAIGEASPKEDETVAKYLEDKKKLEDVKADENQEEDVVTETALEFEKSTGNEEQALDSPQEQQEQDESVQSKQDREENDILNSKFLVQEDDEQSDVEKLEDFTENTQKPLEENAEDHSEEKSRQDKSKEYEKTAMKKEHDHGFSKAKDPEENVAEINPSPESIILQTETTSEETQKELSSYSNTFSTDALQASQDAKETLDYDDSKAAKSSTENQNSVEGLVENEHPENFAQDPVESEKTEESGESLEKTKSIEEETEKEGTLKSQLAGEAKKDGQKVREELDDVEQNEKYQEPSLKVSLDESDNEQKSRETLLQKSLEESEENLASNTDEESLRSENPENETSESNSREMPLQASKQSQEENKEVHETENNDALLKASTPKNIEEIRNTSIEEHLKAEESEQDNRENEDEPQVRAKQTEVEEIDTENEELSLRSENPEKDIGISNESVMNLSASQEKVEAADETVREENKETVNQEEINKTLKATAGETDEPTEEIASAELEKIEKQQIETKNSEEFSREVDMIEEESAEINKSPKLLMSIRKNLGDEKETVKADQEEKSEENGALLEDTLQTTAENDADIESKNMNEEEVPVRAASQEADKIQPEAVQGMQEIGDEDDLNVRADNIKDLNNQVDEGLKDGELRSAQGGSEALNEDDTLKEVNSLELQEFDKDDAVEGVKKVKEPDTPQEVTVGKKKNAPASEVQNYEQSQSKSTLKVPKSIGKIMRDLDGKEKGDYTSLTNLNPEKIDHIIDKIDEAEHRTKLQSEDVDCRKECACADEMNTRSRNIGRYEIVKDFLHWVKDLQLNRILIDD